MGKYNFETKESYSTGDIIECIVNGQSFTGIVAVEPKDLSVKIDVGGYELVAGRHLMYMAPWSYTRELRKDSGSNDKGTQKLLELFNGLLDDCLHFISVKDIILSRRNDYLQSRDFDKVYSDIAGQFKFASNIRRVIEEMCVSGI